MAEKTGVTESGGGNNRSGGNALKGKNKKWLYLGGGGLVLLMLGHKGSSATGNSPAQLQAASDAAAQAQTDAALAGDAASTYPLPGGVAPTTIDTGGGSYTGPTTVNPPAEIVNVPSDTGTTDNAAPDATNDNSLDKSVIAADTATTKADNAATRAEQKDKPKPHTHPKHGKGKPVDKHGRVHHPSEGAKTQHHTGVKVHGREFPGATGHHVGAPRRVNGNTHRDVTVHFPGHSETHTSVNHGQNWIDNVKGRTPPSRAPQHTIHPTTAPAHPAHEPAPVRGRRR